MKKGKRKEKYLQRILQFAISTRALRKVSPFGSSTLHFSDMGHPLVADEIYGGKVVYANAKNDEENSVELMNRVALHSHELGFEHPGSSKWVEFESEIPDDIQHFINFISMGIGYCW